MCPKKKKKKDEEKMMVCHLNDIEIVNKKHFNVLSAGMITIEQHQKSSSPITDTIRTTSFINLHTAISVNVRIHLNEPIQHTSIPTYVMN